MPPKANRCPHCWAALSDFVTDFCPFCRGSVVVKPKRRRAGETPEAPAAPVPPARHEPYEPYQPYWPSPVPPAPAPPVPPPPVPAGDYSAAAAAAAGGGVALAERDPVEFPGTPLPPGFFDALPETVRNPRPRRIPVKAIGVLGVVLVGAIGGIVQAADRNKDLSSPARHLIAGACAEYRDINDRLKEDRTDQDALLAGINWFQSNADRFAEATRLDPKLAAASEVVTWYSNAIEAKFAPFAGMTEADFKAREKPLAVACYTGPGRA